jgi:hypothetical protein
MITDKIVRPRLTVMVDGNGRLYLDSDGQFFAVDRFVALELKSIMDGYSPNGTLRKDVE